MAHGFKTGGRQKGTPNRITSVWREGALSSGLSPLDYLLRVMRDEGEDPDRRLDAAARAAPYVHQRLAAVEVIRPPREPGPEEAAEKRRLIEKLLTLVQHNTEPGNSANAITAIR